MNADGSSRPCQPDRAAASAARVIVPRERHDPVLNGRTITDRVAALHEELHRDPVLNGIGRIAAALYDPARQTVKTFIHASDGANPLGSVAMPLSSIPVLQQILHDGNPRIFDDLHEGGEARSEITRSLLRHGYRSRLVVPIIHQESPFGFVFFNATAPSFFTESAMVALRPHIRTLSMMLIHERAMIRTMLAAVRTARAIGHHRDEETGEHLERMARYAALIAEALSETHGLNDEYIEYLYQYAPLHDIGKVAVPDAILMKPARLTPEEFTVMKTHVAKGLEIVDLMERDIGLAGLPFVDLLHNVVGGHHEALDGSGYPRGISGDAISLEARIIAVADVFDALTSRRPYKGAWSNADALAHLTRLAGKIFDADCVAALTANMDRVAEIQAQFIDSPEHIAVSDDSAT